jgi:hypothetical protein
MRRWVYWVRRGLRGLLWGVRGRWAWRLFHRVGVRTWAKDRRDIGCRWEARQSLGTDLARYGELETSLAIAYVIPFITIDLTISLSLTPAEYMGMRVRATIRSKPPLFSSSGVFIVSRGKLLKKSSRQMTAGPNIPGLA